MSIHTEQSIEYKEAKTQLNDTATIDYKFAEADLSHFFLCAWDVLEPQAKLYWNWHHDLVCEYLMACYTGQIRRLIINIPPRTTKSLLCTVTFPVWVWLQDPRKRFLFGSYADSLARKHSLLRRNLIQSPWFQKYWAKNFQLSDDQNLKSNFTNNKTGQMISAGLLGSITGEGGDYVVIDDPHNPKKANSDTERESSLIAFDQAWSTRLNDKKNGRIIVIMQRLHENDLTGHLLSKNAGYVHLKIPQIAEQKTIYTFPLSGKELTRKAGELLHKERDGLAEIEQIKKDLGSFGFSGQQQQDPSPSGGGLVKRAWWRYYKALPSRFDQTIISMDPTFKGDENNDYVVAQCWGRVGANKYLIDQVRARLDFVTTIKTFRAFCAKHPNAHAKLVEAKANGEAIINTLKNEIPGIIPINPKTSKIQRVEAVAPQIESGNVYLPDPSLADWIGDFVEEWAKMPRVKNDDQVDTGTQAITYLTQNTSGKFSESMVDNSSRVNDVIGDGDKW